MCTDLQQRFGFDPKKEYGRQVVVSLRCGGVRGRYLFGYSSGLHAMRKIRASAGVVAGTMAVELALSGMPAAGADLPRATLSFEFVKLTSGEASGIARLQIENATDKAICIIQTQIPGAGKFDTSLLKIMGPQGEVRPADNLSVDRDDAFWRDTLVVILRGQTYSGFAATSPQEHAFNVPGRYSVSLKIHHYDCAKLGEISSFTQDHPGWHLGALNVRADAVLK